MTIILCTLVLFVKCRFVFTHLLITTTVTMITNTTTRMKMRATPAPAPPNTATLMPVNSKKNSGQQQ